MKDFLFWFRGDRFKISPHFWTWEFDCQCGKCLIQGIYVPLVNQLEGLRTDVHREYGREIPMDIYSGFRCFYHNRSKKVGGVKNSLHLALKAADINCEGVPTDDLYRIAKPRFIGFGLAKTFLHVDLRSGQPAFWTYGGKK